MYMNLLEILIGKNLLSEGVEDPAKLKAIFMAGGPGSGKTRIANELFNVPKDFPLSSYGLKVINSDFDFVQLLKKEKISLDLSKLPPEEFKRLTSGPESLRAKAKGLTDKKFKLFRHSRLGLLIDGTGDTIESIQHKKYLVTSLGYDSYMIFVNTSLEVALQRNKKRDRKLPDELVKQIWSACQENTGHFQKLFGNNFRVVDNSTAGENHKDVIKSVIDFVNAPIKNPMGKRWVDNYYQLKTLNSKNTDDNLYNYSDDTSDHQVKKTPMRPRSQQHTNK